MWSLDRDLAYARHYPAVAWAGSFSRDADGLGQWYARHGDPDWGRAAGPGDQRCWPRQTGSATSPPSSATASLPGHERVVLLAGRLLREGVLQQNALSANDAHCTAAKTAALIDAVLAVVDACEAAVGAGVIATEIEELDFSPCCAPRTRRPPDGR